MRELKIRMYGITDDSPYDDVTDRYLPVMVDGDSLAFEAYEPLCDLLRDDDEHKYMLYTGLKDKNGKEIYEGDIFRTETLNDRIVTFIDGAFVLSDDDGFCEFLSDFAAKGEVIGNIYENPNLLGKEMDRGAFDPNPTLSETSCQMITPDGKIVPLIQVAKFYDFMSDALTFKDNKGNFYRQNWGTTDIYLVDSIVSQFIRPAGKLDIKDYWEAFGDVPMNPETECLEAPFGVFKAGTEREDILHWFEDAFNVSVHDLMYDIESVDKQNLIFDAEDFNLKFDRKFTRKDIEKSQTANQGR